jgi:hypothetical protein
MKYGNYVTRFSFPYLDVPSTQTQFEPRELPGEKLNFDPKALRKAQTSPTGQNALASASQQKKADESTEKPATPHVEEQGIQTTLTSY